MKVSMIGMLQNAADALDAFHGMLGGDDAEGDNADLMYEHQPKMLAYVLRETASNAEELRGDPAALDEFLTLYCLKPIGSDKAGGTE